VVLGQSIGEVARQYKKLTGEEPTTLIPEGHARAIREIRRESEVIELFKSSSMPVPLPPH
jgi:hypothetical protein